MNPIFSDSNLSFVVLLLFPPGGFCPAPVQIQAGFTEVYIESPMFNLGFYPTFLNCTWNVTSAFPSEKQFEIFFIPLDVSVFELNVFSAQWKPHQFSYPKLPKYLNSLVQKKTLMPRCLIPANNSKI